MTTPADSAAASQVLLPGFEYRRMDVEGLIVNYAISGSGPPLLLLHGYPQNHLMWRRVAPALARDHTVVLADLRGYGDSGKPDPDTAGLVYSKRAMARDQVDLMRQLGFESFQLVGHDRSPDRTPAGAGPPWRRHQVRRRGYRADPVALRHLTLTSVMLN